MSFVLLNGLSPLPQVHLDPLNFSFKGDGRLQKFGSLFGILGASHVDPPPKFGRRFNQFPHGCLGLLYLVYLTFHGSTVDKHHLTEQEDVEISVVYPRV